MGDITTNPTTETMTVGEAVDLLAALTRGLGGRPGRTVRVRGALIEAIRPSALRAGTVTVDHDGLDRAATVSAWREPGGMARLEAEVHDGDSRGAVWRTVTPDEAAAVMRELVAAR